MKVQARSRNRRRMQLALGAVAVAAIGAFLFLGGTDLFDATGDTNPIPPASTGGDGGPTVSPTPEESPSIGGRARPVEMWFTQGETLFPDTSAAVLGTDDVLSANMALESLLDGTTKVGRQINLETQIPEGTELLRLDISDGVASVDLTNEFQSGGGSLSMRMRIAQVVYTLTHFESVDGVLFKIDGEPVDSIGGEGVMVDTPQTRKDYEDLLPAITVTSPGMGWDFASGNLISGTANVFEANVSWRIYDEDFNEIASGFTTASCGSGCRGDFSTHAEFGVDHEQNGMLEVLEFSAQDGEPMNIVTIPVVLLPDS